ncbi:MAG: DNA-directed RNA polymerase subunit omega [Actinomycetaceae bacterium]|nr:DNA-directed RNA polymerase subunit omega [Actinomycetaceae bacterium]
MTENAPKPEGITNPPIDSLLDKVDSKYALAVYAAQRARQINEYRQDMTRGDGSMEHIGPLIEDAMPEDKPLSIALEEIVEGKIEWGEKAGEEAGE